MRRLSEAFMRELQTGFLSKITKKVLEDKDLDLHIRKDYLNIYYKGNSLLKLTEQRSGKYKTEIHPNLSAGLDIPGLLIDETTTDQFLRQVPFLKENIIVHGRFSLETEYEQMIIRANNLEARNNSEYFIVDRQYAMGEKGREQLDLMGFFWDRNTRGKKTEVPVCFMEIKFALNADIQNIHDQLSRYYDAVKQRPADIAEEAADMFQQKLDLGIYSQDKKRLEAMRSLEFSKDIDQFQFILIFVDYNPHSTLLNLDRLKTLPFSNQIKIFYSGFAMWEKNMT